MGLLGLGMGMSDWLVECLIVEDVRKVMYCMYTIRHGMFHNLAAATQVAIYQHMLVLYITCLQQLGSCGFISVKNREILPNTDCAIRLSISPFMARDLQQHEFPSQGDRTYLMAVRGRDNLPQISRHEQ
jgi:hypothetical protein